MLDNNGKIKLAVIFGGRSGEHEVSLMSAESVLAVIDQNKYEVTSIGITKDGQWLSGRNVLESLKSGKTSHLYPVTILPDPKDNTLYDISKEKMVPVTQIDVIFPVLHGTFGEDGTLQGLFEVANLAYVGAGVLGSSVGMDKGLFKDVMRAHQIPVLDSILFSRKDAQESINTVIEKITGSVEFPVFIKPANMGSSVGITKCRSKSELFEGIQEAIRFDRRVLAEKGINKAREIEVSVLGNDEPRASIPGEIRPADEFYTYEAKYYNAQSELIIPANLPDELKEHIQQLAIKAYQAIDCAGMARVDFLLDDVTQELYINEINTLPGFTSISMYPKLWEASGIPYAALVNRLIGLALRRKAERDQIEFGYGRK
jgi:D-alanine-D-alanine ligase